MIRNFIYLDAEKLRSLSSQLFEGVTEYVLNSESSEAEKRDQQKGPVASGQVLADIFRQGTSSAQLRFLEDHAYVLFETQLFSEDRVDDVKDDSASDVPVTKQFARITSKLTINDIKEVLRLVKNFNEFGEAMYRVANQTTIEQSNRGKGMSDADVRNAAKTAGMQINKKFADSVGTTLTFGYQDLLEAQMTVGQTLFSAPLKRQSLRESEQMLVQKFSRRSQCNFSLLGMVTQRGSAAPRQPATVAVDLANLKEGMRAMVDHMRDLEAEFTGPMANEIVVDPIAIYMSV